MCLWGTLLVEIVTLLKAQRFGNILEFLLHIFDSLPTCEIRVRIPAQPQVGKLVLLAVGRQFTAENLDQLYVLVSSTLPTIPYKKPIRYLV